MFLIAALQNTESEADLIFELGKSILQHLSCEEVELQLIRAGVVMRWQITEKGSSYKQISKLDLDPPWTPLVHKEKTIGSLKAKADPIALKNLALELVFALEYHFNRRALEERVKELSCLYWLTKTAFNETISTEELLKRLVVILPKSWLYEPYASSRIVLFEKEYTGPGFGKANATQKADIVIDGKICGFVEVIYRARMPHNDEGPFLFEERKLLDAVAHEVSSIIERRNAAAEKARIQEQLKRSERLATIGKMASGVAHELNEPLGAILGFAQLARKHPDLPKKVEQDLIKIEAASLHARDVMSKLSLLGRQAPPKREPIRLESTITECIAFLEPKCIKASIKLAFNPAESPLIIADRGQLYQIIINLVVNAIQASKPGKQIIIEMGFNETHVFFSIQDEGTGIDKSLVNKIFEPFFTTRDQGTGLGLSVVQDAVAAHRGTISVSSQLGLGTRFTVCLPREI